MSENLKKITVEDCSFWVNQKGYEPFWKTVQAGQWEPETIGIINQNLGRGKRFIDCGGWVGATTLVAASIGAQVIVYEPNPMVADVLRENIALNYGFSNRVEIHEIALSHDAGGTIRLYNNKPMGFNNSRSTISVMEGNFIEVKAENAAVIASRDSWASADLIKMDVEAEEYHILKPVCSVIVKESRAELPPLLIEFHPDYVSSNSWFPSAVAECAVALSPWKQRCWAECRDGITIPIGAKLDKLIDHQFFDYRTRKNVENPKILFTSRYSQLMWRAREKHVPA